MSDRAQLGRPREIDRAAIVDATLRPPIEADGPGRWSCRGLGARLGVSEASVARIWREYGIAPRPAGAFAFTVQPELAAARVDVVGVCVTRRVRAVALLVDDTARDRRTRSAAEEPDPDADGSSVTRSGESATKIGVRDFLRRVTASYPDRAVHVVVDSAQLQRLLIQSVPQLTTAGVSVHFALDTDKWLNLVDVWFGLMARDRSTNSDHPAAKIRSLIEHGRTSVWVAPVRGVELDGFTSAAQLASGRLAAHDRR